MNTNEFSLTAAENPRLDQSSLVAPGPLLNVLGVVYAHTTTIDGGDLYLTRWGLPFAELLQIENWYEKTWFREHRQRLEGTSAVYRVPTKQIGNVSLDLVVKNCRVGEDVPLDTHTLLEYINAEFNSPWEEFSLVMEMREGKYGDPGTVLRTQQPLAIYVPGETMQVWQSGRSKSRINRILARHPGIHLDILRQYIFVYGWIKGENIIEAFLNIGVDGDELDTHLAPLTRKAMNDLEKKGYIMADMKPAHIILDEEHKAVLDAMERHGNGGEKDFQLAYLRGLIEKGDYSLVDYELLLRSPEHEQEVTAARRHSYLDDMRDRFIATPLPPHLDAVEIMGVPYIHGHVESTGGQLWVVGRNTRLFDYFLPERWRRTPCWKLSENNEVYYTVTKDRIHLVWKTSRVGEKPADCQPSDIARQIEACGYNSPFEEFAIAYELNARKTNAVYCRAIYMTGSRKIELSEDRRRYESHRGITGAGGLPVLRENHNYITLRGYYNGSDKWVAEQIGTLCRPLSLNTACETGKLEKQLCTQLFTTTRKKLADAGYDGSLLDTSDMLVVLDPHGELVRDGQDIPEVLICNFELIMKKND